MWEHSKNTENGPFWALQSIGPFTLHSFKKSCNSAAEDNLADPERNSKKSAE